MLSFKPTFSLSSLLSSRGVLVPLHFLSLDISPGHLDSSLCFFQLSLLFSFFGGHLLLSPDSDILCLLYVIFIGFTFSFVVGDNFLTSFTILLVPFSLQSKLDFNCFCNNFVSQMAQWSRICLPMQEM